MALALTEEPSLKRVHCSGCGRTVGYTKAKRLNGAVICTLACDGTPEATSTEERDDLIVALYRRGKQGRVELDTTGLAIRFGLTRQRVHQILQSRGVIA